MAETTLPAAPTGEPKNMRTFLTIWAGQFVSMLGSGLTSFAIGVWIFQQTGQAMPFALTVLFANLPCRVSCSCPWPAPWLTAGTAAGS